MFPGALRAFYEVARAGSIRKAGDAMRLSPSSVSRQVAVLERQMGTRLVERSSGGIKLTHAGELVATFARTVLLEFDALKIDLNDMRGSRRRLIRLACVESIASSGPSLAMVEYKKIYQDIIFEFSVMPAKQVVEAIKKDLCDIGITQNPSPDPDIHSIANVPEPIVLAVSAGHLMASRDKVSLAELAELDLAMPNENFGVRTILNDALFQEGIRPSPALVSNSFEVLRSYVLASGGGAVIPLRAVKNYMCDDHLVAVSIDSPPLLGGAIHIIARRDRRMPRVLQTFVQMLVERL